MSINSYPVNNDKGEISQAALNRLGDFYAKNFPPGTEITDPFLADVKVALTQAMIAFGSLQAVAQGVFTSCEHEDQYASGVVHPSHRIYTPAEAMKQQLVTIRSLG